MSPDPQVQKEYMDQQISQKVEFYRREEKRLRLGKSRNRREHALRHVTSFGPVKDSFITQDRNEQIKGVKVEATFSRGHISLI